MSATTTYLRYLPTAIVGVVEQLHSSAIFPTLKLKIAKFPNFILIYEMDIIIFSISKNILCQNNKTLFILTLSVKLKEK